jgi:glycosyltransferase involved in cell wall biosynthesis
VYRGCTVAVVMPAFNVEQHLVAAVRSVPRYVDHLVVVDDGSTDGTPALLAALRPRPTGLISIRHGVNRGVGAAIATGYAESLRLGAEAVAVMAGDGQMDPGDLHGLLDPLIDRQADYVKGNRFRHRDVWRVMPRARLLGNIGLSLLTKLTSGYWGLFDSQCGYTAISQLALRAIDGRVFARYGYPNDILARLRVVGARVSDVPVRPIYDGQPSGIRLWTVVYPVLFVLLRSMARRLWRQRFRPLLPGAGAQHGDRLLRGKPDDGADRPADHVVSAPRP